MSTTLGKLSLRVVNFRVVAALTYWQAIGCGACQYDGEAMRRMQPVNDELVRGYEAHGFYMLHWWDHSSMRSSCTWRVTWKYDVTKEAAA